MTHTYRDCPDDSGSLVDANGEPLIADMEWPDMRTPGLGLALRDATVERVMMWEDNNDAPVGMPGDRVLVMVVGLGGSLLGSLVGYEAASIALCVHGDPPPLRIDGTAGQGRTWYYCHGCGIYIREDMFDGHKRNPALTALADQRRAERRSAGRR